MPRNHRHCGGPKREPDQGLEQRDAAYLRARSLRGSESLQGKESFLLHRLPQARRGGRHRLREVRWSFGMQVGAHWASLFVQYLHDLLAPMALSFYKDSITSYDPIVWTPAHALLHGRPVNSRGSSTKPTVKLVLKHAWFNKELHPPV